MTWNAYNRRKEALREVLAVVDSNREAADPAKLREANPTKLFDEIDAAHQAFDSVADMMLDVQSHWYQRLSGQLDRALADGDGDLEETAIIAWSEAAAQMTGVRALLDASIEMPELDKARANEYAILARAAGRQDDLSYGKWVQGVAKSQFVDVAIPDSPAGLFTRIREVLAA